MRALPDRTTRFHSAAPAKRSGSLAQRPHLTATLRLGALVAALLSGALPSTAGAVPGAATVSPGEIERAAPVASPCPTFNWSAVAGAAGYEIVVVDEADPRDPHSLLRHRVAGAALGWTPSSDSCLRPGASYAWSVRALDATGEPLPGEPDWASLRRFTVPSLPSAAEVTAAFELLRRYQAAAEREAPPTGEAAGRHTLANRASEASGTAAIRGENPSTGASQHGIWGQTASATSGGLVGVNSAGGPDLVLDGTAQSQTDTHLTQAGIDRPSATAQSFNIQNSGGGGIALLVQGSAVSLAGHAHAGEEINSGTVADARIAATLTRDSEVMSIVLASDGPGSGLDADTLDGVQSSSYQLRVTGVCSSSETLQGINADGSVICTDLPRPPSLAVVDDPTNHVGTSASLAVGTDGFPVISYYDATSSALKVAKCNDAACAGADETITTVDNSGTVGLLSSIAIGTDGFPVISYYDSGNADLKVAKCDDNACSGANESISTVESAGNLGRFSSLKVGIDGNPVISYFVDTTADLRVAKCNDVACAGGDEAITTVDSLGTVGMYSALFLGADGFPVVSYYDTSNTALKVVKCADASCSNFNRTVTTVDNAAAVGEYTSLALGNDGLPVISYYDATSSALKVAKCNDAACAGANEVLSTIDNTAAVGQFSSMRIGSDGFPVIAYYDGTSFSLKVAKCANQNCRN